MRWIIIPVLLLVTSQAYAIDPKPVRIWKAKCAPCHGDDGKADTEQGHKMGMRSVTSADWQRSFTDDQMRATIRDGFKRTKDGKTQEMDAFKDKIADADIAAVAAYMRSLGPALPPNPGTKPAETKPAEKPPEPKPVPAKVEATPAGLKLWKSKCASCHGADGKGSKKTPLDMTAAAWQSSHDEKKLNELLGMAKPVVEVKGKSSKHFSKLKATDVPPLVTVVRSFGT
jgi:mono/diheme cytochrome c family protein